MLAPIRGNIPEPIRILHMNKNHTIMHQLISSNFCTIFLVSTVKHDGDHFEIDARAIKAVLNDSLAARLSSEARQSDKNIQARMFTTS
jgi:hypothetical protein